MSAHERLDRKPNAFSDVGQPNFGGLDNMVKGWEPAMKGLGRFNLELAGLMTSRARAWLEIPARLSQCKTPQDLINEQLRFWQTAASQYAVGSHRLFATLGVSGVPNLLNGDGRQGPHRDLISFPETQEPTPSTGPRRSENRAA